MNDDEYFTTPEFAGGEHSDEPDDRFGKDEPDEADDRYGKDELDEADDPYGMDEPDEADDPFGMDEFEATDRPDESYGIDEPLEADDPGDREVTEVIEEETDSSYGEHTEEIVLPEKTEEKPRRTEAIPPRYGYYKVQEHQQEEKNSEYKENRITPSRDLGRNSSSGGSFLKKLAGGIFLAALFGFTAALVFNLVSPLLSGKSSSASQVESAETVPESSSSSRSMEAEAEEAEGGQETEAAVRTQDSVDETMKTADAGKTESAEETAAAEETSVTEETVSDFVSTGKGNVADVASASMPSIVAITSVSIQEFSDFWGYRRQYASEGSGSGILVGDNGEELLIATNNHVIAGTSTLQVFFYGDDVQVDPNATGSRNRYGFDEEKAVPAVIKGADEENDLAVIAVKKADVPAETLQKIRIAVLGSSEDLVVGEQVVAIGNALGYGQSVTSGWISAMDRIVVSEDGTVARLIQTDAAINPGNSGGALLNLKGEVIGINSAKYANYAVEGMGYAIPISKASPILEEMMNRETREKLAKEDSGYLGVSLVDLSDKMRIMYSMPSGAFVEEVYSDSPADQSGLQRGDIIMKIDGQTVSNGSAVIDLLQYYAPGETVDVVIARSDAGEYRQQTLSVTLGQRPYN